jgi:hypothetical protein
MRFPKPVPPPSKHYGVFLHGQTPESDPEGKGGTLASSPQVPNNPNPGLLLVRIVEPHRMVPRGVVRIPWSLTPDSRWGTLIVEFQAAQGTLEASIGRTQWYSSLVESR